jgi:hypothetical protein
MRGDFIDCFWQRFEFILASVEYVGDLELREVLGKLLQ